jgi:hypothetical protein
VGSRLPSVPAARRLPSSGMARTTGGAADKKPGGRARKKAASAQRQRQQQSPEDANRTQAVGRAGADSDPGAGPEGTGPEGTRPEGTGEAGRAGEDPRGPGGLEALAAMRVPRTVPPPPGGVLPTTRRGMLRYRVLPRGVLGISLLILSFAIGSGLSGVILYSYYQFKINQTNDRVNTLINGYKAQFNKAEADLNASEAAAKAQIAEAAKNAQSTQAGPSEIAHIIQQVSPSVFFVHTLDSAGQPSVGTAFVISSNGSRSLLLTSYTTVQADTHAPGPAIFVTQGDSTNQSPVTLSTWDAQYDLALLTLPKGGLTPLQVAPTSPAPQPGDRLFVVSGLGSAGAALSQGTVIDVSASGMQLDAAIGSAFQGGPVINQSGQVIAVGSRQYSPLGFTSSAAFFVPYVEAACNKVLSCPGGSLVGSH